MPIPIPDFFQFGFNNGRGLRANQVADVDLEAMDTKLDGIDEDATHTETFADLTGQIADDQIPASIMRDAEFTAAAIRTLLGLSATELNDLLTGATIAGQVLTFPQNDGTTVQLTIPTAMAGTGDGVVQSGSIDASGTSLTLTLDNGGVVVVDIPAVLRSMAGLTEARVQEIVDATALSALQGQLTDGQIPADIMRDAEFTAAAIRTLLGLTPEELNDLLTGAVIVGQVLTFSQNDGTAVQITIPTAMAGSGDGVVQSGTINATGTELTLTLDTGGTVVIDIPTILRTVGLTDAERHDLNSIPGLIAKTADLEVGATERVWENVAALAEGGFVSENSGNLGPVHASALAYVTAKTATASDAGNDYVYIRIPSNRNSIHYRIRQHGSLGEFFISAWDHVGPHEDFDYYRSRHNLFQNYNVTIQYDAATATPTHFRGASDAADVAVESSGFDGTLLPTDDDVQKVAQKVNDLVLSGIGGQVTDAQIPAGIMRDAEFTAAAVRNLLGLTADELNDLLTGAVIAGQVLTFSQNDGTAVQITIPTAMAGSGDGVVQSGTINATGTELTLTLDTGGTVVIDIPAILRTIGRDELDQLIRSGSLSGDLVEGDHIRDTEAFGESRGVSSVVYFRGQLYVMARDGLEGLYINRTHAVFPSEAESPILVPTFDDRHIYYATRSSSGTTTIRIHRNEAGYARSGSLNILNNEANQYLTALAPDSAIGDSDNNPYLHGTIVDLDDDVVRWRRWLVTADNLALDSTFEISLADLQTAVREVVDDDAATFELYNHVDLNGVVGTMVWGTSVLIMVSYVSKADGTTKTALIGYSVDESTGQLTRDMALDYEINQYIDLFSLTGVVQQNPGDDAYLLDVWIGTSHGYVLHYLDPVQVNVRWPNVEGRPDKPTTDEITAGTSADESTASVADIVAIASEHAEIGTDNLEDDSVEKPKLSASVRNEIDRGGLVSTGLRYRINHTATTANDARSTDWVGGVFRVERDVYLNGGRFRIAEDDPGTSRTYHLGIVKVIEHANDDWRIPTDGDDISRWDMRINRDGDGFDSDWDSYYTLSPHHAAHGYMECRAPDPTVPLVARAGEFVALMSQISTHGVDEQYYTIAFISGISGSEPEQAVAIAAVTDQDITHPDFDHEIFTYMGEIHSGHEGRDLQGRRIMTANDVNHFAYRMELEYSIHEAELLRVSTDDIEDDAVTEAKLHPDVRAQLGTSGGAGGDGGAETVFEDAANRSLGTNGDNINLTKALTEADDGTMLILEIAGYNAAGVRQENVSLSVWPTHRVRVSDGGLQPAWFSSTGGVLRANYSGGANNTLELSWAGGGFGGQLARIRVALITSAGVPDSSGGTDAELAGNTIETLFDNRDVAEAALAIVAGAGNLGRSADAGLGRLLVEADDDDKDLRARFVYTQDGDIRSFDVTMNAGIFRNFAVNNEVGTGTTLETGGYHPFAVTDGRPNRALTSLFGRLGVFVHGNAADEDVLRIYITTTNNSVGAISEMRGVVELVPRINALTVSGSGGGSARAAGASIIGSHSQIVLWRYNSVKPADPPDPYNADDDTFAAHYGSWNLSESAALALRSAASDPLWVAYGGTDNVAPDSIVNRAWSVFAVAGHRYSGDNGVTAHSIRQDTDTAYQFWRPDGSRSPWLPLADIPGGYLQLIHRSPAFSTHDTTIRYEAVGGVGINGHNFSQLAVTLEAYGSTDTDGNPTAFGVSDTIYIQKEGDTWSEFDTNADRDVQGTGTIKLRLDDVTGGSSARYGSGSTSDDQDDNIHAVPDFPERRMSMNMNIITHPDDHDHLVGFSFHHFASLFAKVLATVEIK